MNEDMEHACLPLTHQTHVLVVALRAQLHARAQQVHRVCAHLPERAHVRHQAGTTSAYVRACVRGLLVHRSFAQTVRECALVVMCGGGGESSERE